MSTKSIFLGILVAICSAAVFAQSPSAGFDVAVIKPSNPDIPGMSFRNMPNGIQINGATLKMLIMQAYDVRDYQISGGPGWIQSDRYDISAKSEQTVTPTNRDPEKDMQLQRERMRTLLQDRFKLQIRKETKEQQAYVLVQSKNGHKLKPSDLEAANTVPGADPSKPPLRKRSMSMGPGTFLAQSVPVGSLTSILAQQLGRPVIDKTGLQGVYDITLKWKPDMGAATQFVSPTAPPATAPPETNEASIFVALQEQLGLKLEPHKAPVEFIIIESAEKPSEN